MFSRFGLSTTVCSVPAAPQPIFQRWHALRGDHQLDLASDPRLPASVQRELFALARDAGVAGMEVAHPFRLAGRLAVPSPISADPDERRAAARALVETMQLAEEYGVLRVMLYPWRLPMAVSDADLRRSFARGEMLPWEKLEAQREAMAYKAFDRLYGAIEPLLDRAAAVGGEVLCAGPAIWPQQLPRHDEIDQLCAVFAGAPLRSAHFTDWEHVGGCLAVPWLATDDSVIESAGRGTSALAGPAGRLQQWLAADVRPAAPGSLLVIPSALALPVALDEPPESAASAAGSPASPGRLRPAHAGRWRLADAAGLMTRLPLGCGEIAWDEVLSEPEVDGDAVLAFDEETTAVELARSVDRLAELQRSTAKDLD